METPAARGLKLRWWMWVVMALMLAGSAIIALRMHGKARYEHAVAEAHARGWPSNPMEFLSVLPAVDQKLQQNLWQLTHRPMTWGDKLQQRPIFADRVRSREEAASLASHAAGAGDAADVSALVKGGRIAYSTSSWLPRDPVAIAQLTPQELYTAKIPNLLQTRALAKWWAVQAEDPVRQVEALANLDAWHRLHDQPATLIDAMITWAVSSMRDQCWMFLATRGRLNAEHVTSWATEPAQHRRWLADGFRGDRCLFQTPTFANGRPVDSRPTMASLVVWSIYRFWHHEGAYAISSSIRCEVRLRDMPEPALASIPFGYRGLMVSTMVSNLEACIPGAIEAAYKHRLMRVVGLLGNRHRQGSAIPDTLADLTALLPPNLLSRIAADEPAIGYERLGPARLRVGLVPGTPLPPSIPAERWLEPNASSTIGAPAECTSYISRGWSLEVDFDAILIPPPEPPPKAKNP